MKRMISALLLAAILPAFGQNMTATKTYVDRQYLAATSAVPSIVTNEVTVGFTEWTVLRNGVDVTSQINQPYYSDFDGMWFGTRLENDEMPFQFPNESDRNAIYLTWMNDIVIDGLRVGVRYVSTRKRIIRNALGLARLSDIADLATTNFAMEVVEGKISPDNAAFSNAVLSVGIGVDTNAVAAINALLDGGDDALPVGGAATVGGLLAALAAALAALKKKVMEKYPFIASAVAGDTLTLAPFSRNALTSDGTAFTVLMGGDGTYLRDCVFVVTAGVTAPTISWGEEDGQTFAPRTDSATDMEIAANTTKVFWVSEYAPDCFVVAGWEVPSVSK